MIIMVALQKCPKQNNEIISIEAIGSCILNLTQYLVFILVFSKLLFLISDL